MHIPLLNRNSEEIWNLYDYFFSFCFQRSPTESPETEGQELSFRILAIPFPSDWNSNFVDFTRKLWATNDALCRVSNELLQQSDEFIRYPPKMPALQAKKMTSAQRLRSDTVYKKTIKLLNYNIHSRLCFVVLERVLLCLLFSLPGVSGFCWLRKPCRSTKFLWYKKRETTKRATG